MLKIINKHNTKILNEQTDNQNKRCNCIDPEPMSIRRKLSCQEWNLQDYGNWNREADTSELKWKIRIQNPKMSFHKQKILQ